MCMSSCDNKSEEGLFSMPLLAINIHRHKLDQTEHYGDFNKLI